MLLCYYVTIMLLCFYSSTLFYFTPNPHILRKSGFLVIPSFLHSRYALPGNMQLPPRTVILRGYKSPALEGLIFSSLKKSAVVRRNRSEK